MITSEQLASELGADLDEVCALVSDLNDASLYDVEAGLLTPDGAALVRDRLTYSS